MVRHQAPSPYPDFGRAAILGKQVAVKRIVGIAKEGTRAATATLGNMVRVAGDDDTGETATRHYACEDAERVKCTVTVIRAATVDMKSFLPGLAASSPWGGSRISA